MKKLKSGLLLLGVLIMVGMCFLLTGCGQSTPGATEEKGKSGDADPLKFYQAVTLNQDKAEVEKTLGVATQEKVDASCYYEDPDSGYTVMVLYGEKDNVLLKTLIIPNGDAKALAALNKTTVTADQVANITIGMTAEEVKKILGGDGVEVISGDFTGSASAPVYGKGWYNQDNTMAMIFFDGQTGLVTSADFKGD